LELATKKTEPRTGVNTNAKGETGKKAQASHHLTFRLSFGKVVENLKQCRRSRD